jgi:hypothetical protein
MVGSKEGRGIREDGVESGELPRKGGCIREGSIGISPPSHHDEKLSYLRARVTVRPRKGVLYGRRKVDYASWI